MDSIKIAFIINPHSGTNKKVNLPNMIESIIDKNKFETTICFTEYAGHGNVLAKQFAVEGYDAVVACGGDGTVNEVASALTETDTALAVIPSGSGNGLARHLHIPLNAQGALELINKFPVSPLDYGTVNGKKFFCTCGSGFDAQVSADFAKQGTRGLLTYLKVILKDYWNYQPQTYIIDDGKEKHEEKAFVVTFANASQYGNDGFIAPLASAQDGLLDVCVLLPFHWYSIPKIAYQLLTRKLHHNSHLKIYKAKDVLLRRESAGPFHYDGDPTEFGEEIKVSIVHGALKVVADEETKTV
ncbi:MAG: diacylglycerol kinase family lipid kinase [Paludibacteraceae bacterium]|nr:diacylglycerol kinase family lipid kinase [Paludibacteraceae bacterium]